METKHTPDAFERSLRRTLEQYEVPYNSADWQQLEQQLAKAEMKRGKWSAGLLALLLGGGIAFATTVFLYLNSQDEGQRGAALSLADHEVASGRSNAPAEEPAEEHVAHPRASERPERLAQQPKQTDRAAAEVRATGVKAAVAQRTAPVPAAEPATPLGHAAGTNEVSIKPSVTEGCPGTSVEFEVTNLPAPGTRMLWNFGDGSFSTDPAPKHAYNKAGRYEVTLSMSSQTGGTIFNKPVSDVIVIHERPEAAFNPMPQEYLDRVPSVHFENKSLKGTSYFWDFGDGSTSSLQVPTHVYKKKGEYTVSLVVTNAIGCTDRTERTVRIKEDYNLLAANAFSPNGDGVEETFIPDALKTLGRRFRMTIHDPGTGALIYETSDVNRPWNGRVNGGGTPCPTGDYVWMVEMKDGESLGGTYTGTVSLLR